ncbi:MAG: LptF/LptG family permease [Opitutales bacterium]
MLFTRLDRLVLFEWLKAFAMTLAVIVGLFVVGDVQNHLDELLAFGASTGEILRYYLIVTPTFLPGVLPLTVLISVLIAFSSLHRRLELVAMRNAGLSLGRISLYCWVSGVLLAGGLFWLNGQFVPWSTETSRQLWDQYRFAGELDETGSREEVGVVPNLTFNNVEADRRWFINRFSEYDYHGYGITISFLDEGRNETRRLVANRGYYDDLAGHWVLLEGREVTFDPRAGDMVRNLGFERRELPDLTEDPTLMQYLKRRPQDLSFWQLQRVIEVLERAEDPAARKYAMRYYRTLVTPIDVLIALALGVHFAVGPIRANPLVGVAQAIGAFLLYFAVVQATGMLVSEAVPAFWAALAPSLLMLVASLWLFRRTSKPVR